MRRRLRRLRQAWLELLFPPRCAACGRPSRELICSACAASLPRISGKRCRFCGKPTVRPLLNCRECRGRRFYFNWAASIWKYEGAAKELVQAFKYKNERRLAPLLAAELADILAEKDIDLITWVPLHRAKKAARGYNQAELIGRETAVLLGVESGEVLHRRRRTADQNKLERRQRLSNVKEAFALSGRVDIDGRRLIIVDDVYTTGATINECARILKQGGAAAVGAVTLARAVSGY